MHELQFSLLCMHLHSNQSNVFKLDLYNSLLANCNASWFSSFSITPTRSDYKATLDKLKLGTDRLKEHRKAIGMCRRGV